MWTNASAATDLVPLGLGAVHQQHAQRVRLGTDVQVQEVVAGHGQLHLRDTLGSHVWQATLERDERKYRYRAGVEVGGSGWGRVRTVGHSS